MRIFEPRMGMTGKNGKNVEGAGWVRAITEMT